MDDTIHHTTNVSDAMRTAKAIDKMLQVLTRRNMTETMAALAITMEINLLDAIDMTAPEQLQFNKDQLRKMIQPLLQRIDTYQPGDRKRLLETPEGQAAVRKLQEQEKRENAEWDKLPMGKQGEA